MSSSGSAGFSATLWDMIAEAKQDEAVYCRVMNRLITDYWPPVFRFLRARGYPAHRAEDLTQEFFLAFFEKDWLARADQGRGRFRNYLQKILVRFLSDRGAERAPRQRHFEDRLVAVSDLVHDKEWRWDPPAEMAPEDVFMREWAQSTVDNTMRHLQNWCDNRGKSEWFEIFEATNLPAPGTKKATQEALAGKLDMTRNQVRYALEQTGQAFAEFIRAEVGLQVESDQDIDDELAQIERLLDGID